MAQRAAVATEALRWLGTPYHHHGRLHGVGVDCAMLLCEVYSHCGVVPHIDPGHYPQDWHLHRSEEVFLGWVERSGAREVQTPALGDVGLWRFGRTWSHGSIVVANDLQLVHAWMASGSVILTRVSEAPLQGRAVRWFTPFTD